MELQSSNRKEGENTPEKKRSKMERERDRGDVRRRIFEVKVRREAGDGE
ncbi:hypothetical protein CCACVL1_31040 [Corchorus capsularis]|uniref:Uncharacterized protein n=1 Tax=Corchorus capsularis TaxID=210143 RepID=A0A1R3FU34_COCAP|nr:hypothetical protein CCACVL1_31040 [Corchorus capsularis]